ncbi:MAG: hypothetical protein HWD92_05605 [Flavobacteriia bacterium]|nr:hypothetical protein [Flavobacteriia bacterium]
MTLQVILTVVTVAMLGLTIKKRDKEATLLTSSFSLSILVLWLGISWASTLGFFLHGLTSLLVVFLATRNNALSKMEKVTIITAGAVSSYWFFAMFIHLPHAIEPALFTASLGLYLVSLFKGIHTKSAFGYLTILNVEHLFALIKDFS